MRKIKLVLPGGSAATYDHGFHVRGSNCVIEQTGVRM
jgi:hypothetical protein